MTSFETTFHLLKTQFGHCFEEKENVDLSNIYSLQAAVCNKLYYYDRSYP